jgi:DNA-binding NarL/FixJ family response regulator
VIRVLLVDDEHLVRSGLRMILEAAGDISVVAEASNGEQAVAAAARHRPDVMLMDVRMPGGDGLSAAAQITARADAPRVVMLTTFDRDEYVHRALRAGAVGFLLKDTPPLELAAAVRTIAEGNAMLAPTVTRRLISSFADRDPDRTSAARRRLEALTARELQVLQTVAEGLSNADIAQRLDMQEATVKTHVSRALTKLHLTNRVQAAILVHDAGLDRP